MSYKFIYFDLDDTLLDHKSAEASALKDVLHHFSLFSGTSHKQLVEVYHDVNSVQWSKYSKGKVTREELQRNRFEQTLAQLDLDASRHEEVGNYYMQCYRNHWQWVDGAEVTYQKVLQHYPVGILTNGFAETQRKKFEKFEFYDTAECTVISEDAGVLKPDPKVFQYATDLAEVEPREILYVGDSFSSDIEGGSRFGWNTAWYSNNGNPEKQEKADFVFSNFNNLIKHLDL